MAEMPPLAQPPVAARDNIWQQHKSTLRQLYQVERRKLSDVKIIMERDYDFPDTPLSTYESKLRQLCLRKKMKNTDWHAVYQELQRRGERKSAVYLCGTKIPSTKAWKEIRRSGARSSYDGQQRQLPREVAVRTPSPGRQTPPLPLVFRHSNNNPSRGILSSQSLTVTLRQTAHLPLDRKAGGSTEMPILDVPSTVSEFYRALLQHTPSWVFRLELSRILEKSPIIRLMAHGDHLDLGSHPLFAGDHVSVNSNWSVPLAIRNVPSFQTLGLTTNFHYLFNITYLLSNSMMYGEEENHCFENLLAQFPTSLLITLLASNSPTLRVVFEKILTYLFDADRRDDFQALIEAMAHDHPDWLAPDIGKYLFYAATMHCLHACELLLEVESIRFVGYLSEDPYFDTLQKILKGEHRHYDLAIFSAISAGYLDCARLLIRHVAENYPLPQDHNHDTTLPPYHGLASHNIEYPENQLTCTFLHAIVIIGRGGFSYRSHGTRRGARMIPLRYEMETVQHAFDIFIEFGLNVDALMPSWLQDDIITKWTGFSHILRKYYEAILISRLHVDLQTPIHLLPTILEVVWNINEEIFHYLVGDSKRVATGLTRSGLYLAAERGSGYLRQYLDAAWSQPLECREFFELVLAEQFTLRFDLDIVQTLLSRGIGFGAFPQDFNMSLLLERLVTEVKQHGIKTYALDIFNQLLREGATIDADVILVAVESQGTNLLTLLSGYGTDFTIHGTSAIFIAALLDNYQAVDYLLEAGVDINAGIHLYDELITIVGAFFKMGYPSHYPDILQKPLSRYNRYFYKWNRKLDFEGGFTASMLKYLIGRGASLCPHPGNSQPNSLLLYAIIVGKGRPDILEIVTYLLVVQGGFHNPSDSQPCLFEACFQGHQNCLHSISKDILGCSLRFFNLVINSSVPIKGSGVLSLLIEHGAAIDLIQMVMDKGVNVNTYSGRGIEHRRWGCCQITPLQAAARRGKLSLVKTLVNNGAEINLPAKGFGGSTALQAACQFYPTTDGERSTKTRLVNYLINKGADVNASAAPVGGFTALQAAARLGDIQTAIVLLDHGADVNAQPSQENGWCALDAAAFFGRLDMTKFLLDLGALSWDRGESGYASAIKQAENRGHWAVADLIRERATLCMQIRSAFEEDGT